MNAFAISHPTRWIDLTTRSGLKKVHLNLSNIQRPLDDTFNKARIMGNGAVMGGIIAIYAKMCLVALIFQDKIVERGEFATAALLLRHFALGTINSLAPSKYA